MAQSQQWKRGGGQRWHSPGSGGAVPAYATRSQYSSGSCTGGSLCCGSHLPRHKAPHRGISGLARRRTPLQGGSWRSVQQEQSKCGRCACIGVCIGFCFSVGVLWCALVCMCV